MPLKPVTAWLERINEINTIIEPLMQERAVLEHKIIESKSAFAVGDVIVWKAGKIICKGRVTKIKEWICGDPMWIVRRILNDGSDGEECEVRPYKNPVRSN